ncbi:LEPR-XLL domain-containing protein [Pseudomonas kurunegalensis]|uniref:LEPR-XLL domain-containing protein n=1 Tax=Pseudomonas kurunegalensis TaxID=485880 RepID=UPI0032ED05A8
MPANLPGSSLLHPKRQTLALEPRILFDGAAAVAASDAHQSDPAKPADSHIDNAPHAVVALRRAGANDCASAISGAE